MRVEIVPLSEQHSKISYKWRNNPEIWVLTGSSPNKKITYEMEKEWIINVVKRTDEKRFAIIVDDVYVGNVQLTNIKNLDAEFHIFIGNTDYWGKGIATTATRLMLDKAFLQFGLKKIYLFVNENNKPAIIAYQKNGFIIIEKNNNQLKMQVKHDTI